MSETPNAENDADTCEHTGMAVDVCLCMIHDPDGAHFRATRPGMTNVFPPAETEHGLPFPPPENEEPTCPTCGQDLFTHGIVGRCIPPAPTDAACHDCCAAWTESGGREHDSTCPIPPGGGVG